MKSFLKVLSSRDIGVQMKLLPKATLALYLLILLWLILFKLSFDLPSVLDHQARSFNIVPFAGFTQDSLREIIDNFVVFIPLGLLLSVGFKQTTFWKKLAFVSTFSLTTELVQFVLAIGVTDLTDVITNTSGGLIGLALYDLGKKYVNPQKLDQFIVVLGIVLLILFLLLRFLVLKVKY